MFKISTLFCCICLVPNVCAQDGIQVQADNYLDIEDLVKNVFIKGNCRNVSNIKAIGNDTLSIGQFSSGTNAINISSGIILSTGDIKLAEGPNIDNEVSYAFNAESNDLDLSQSATGKLFDVAGIEFDFVPMDDRVTFQYVFASEEYCEFVGTSFNDVFGFFVSGPGINGPFENNAINVATITTLIGTTDNVSINNINHLKNETFYVNNITTTDAQNCEISYVPMFQELIKYDGFTIPLTASFQVIPCETYHIRLVLGDVGDANLDSAVFLASKSFDLGEKVTIHAEVSGREEPIAYENCVDGQFVFTRNSSTNINEDCTVQYRISDESLASNGLDFLEIPLSVTIPAGQNCFVLPIALIEDNILEGFENLKLEQLYDCDCIDPIPIELFIDEVNTLSANFEEISVCPNQPFSIAPQIMGGVEPYNFLWETGATTDSLEESTSATTQYNLTITDFCDSSILAIANIDVQPIPMATLAGTYNICETSLTGIPVQLEGNPPWKIRYCIDGVEQLAIENIETTPFYLETPTEGVYTLTEFEDAYCKGSISGNAVIESPFLLDTDITFPSCLNTADGSIEIKQLEGVAPFSIKWNIETEDDYLLEKLQQGIYTLSITDSNDCIYEKSFDLRAISNNTLECLPIYIPNVFTPNNDGINDVFSIFFDNSEEIDNVVYFQIYNRWGEQLFEQKNLTSSSNANGWNGNFKQKPLDAGVYVYQILMTLKDGSTLHLSGDVTLIR